MRNTYYNVFKESKKKLIVISILLFLAIFYLACNGSGENNAAKENSDVLAENFSGITYDATVPTDIPDPADPSQAAAFAWQEFIALTWPAKVNPSPGQGLSGYYRGQASETEKSGSTGSGGVTVWETFYHRAELYPTYNSSTGNNLPNKDTVPYYNYGGPIPSLNGANQNLFNNLDETSEITLAYMYSTPLAKKLDSVQKSITGKPTPAQSALIKKLQIKAGLVYEAKGNPVFRNYLDTTGFNNLGLRSPAMTNNINLLTKNIQPTGKQFVFPSGTIEIKATWKHYDVSVDNLDDYHWTVGIYYTTDAAQNTYANNDTFLLVGLHIIQKTPNVPTFTFATFEHVDNEKNGFRFLNTNPGTVKGVLPRPLPDSFLRTAIRQYPIPDSKSKFDLVAFNSSVQNQLRSKFGKKNVWANYQLIGVQAVVQDDPGGVVPDQQFFLSNFATETNNALQFFQGGLAGTFANVPNPNAAHVFVYNKDSSKYIGHTSGGCLGCHGSQGQFQGGDFSVISATGNNFFPDTVTPYPGGPVYNQNPSGFPLPHSTKMPEALRKAVLNYVSPKKKIIK